MQKLITLILAGLVVTLGVVCFWQANELSNQKAAVAKLKADLETFAYSSIHQQKSLTSIAQDKAEASAATSAKKSEHHGAVSGDASTASGTDDKKGDFRDMMAKMMKDPEMKKAIVAQQGALIKKMYGPLFKSLNLSPEETEKFNSLLSAHQLAAMDAGTALMGGDGDKAEATKNVQDETKQYEDQVKQLLGDERYNEYTDYKQSLTDRMALDQFKGQMGDTPLNEDQSRQLLQLMIAERKKAGANVPEGSAAYKLMDDEGALNKLMDQAALSQQEVLKKAADILSAEQLKSFGEFQSNQLALQKAGIAMAQTFMGKKTNSSAIPGAPANQ